MCMRSCLWLGKRSKVLLPGPATVLSFLGIEVDTQLLELCLPQEKLAMIVKEVTK